MNYLPYVAIVLLLFTNLLLYSNMCYLRRRNGELRQKLACRDNKDLTNPKDVL